jgi:hypothetical protein
MAHLSLSLSLSLSLHMYICLFSLLLDHDLKRKKYSNEKSSGNYSKTVFSFFFSFTLYIGTLETEKASEQGCQIFLGTTYQNRKNTPNNHKISQRATKYTK